MIPPQMYPTPPLPRFYPTIPVFYSIEPYRMSTMHQNEQKSILTTHYQFRTEDFPTLPMKSQQPMMGNHVSSVEYFIQFHFEKKNKRTKIHFVLFRSSLPNWSSVVSSAVQSPKTEPKRKKNVKNKKQQQNKTDMASVPTITAVVQPAIVPSPMSNPLSIDDDSQYPALGTEVPVRTVTPSSPVQKTNTIPMSRVKAHQTYEIRLSDMFNALSTSTQTKRTANENKQTHVVANPLDSRPAPKRGKERENPKPRKPTKLKRIINKELEQNRKQRQENRQKTHSDAQDEQSKCSYSQTNTSASCSEEEEEEGEEESNDEDLEDDHQPASQSQTPFAQQLPASNLKQQIHDGTFREYCTQLIDRQLDEVCVQLLLTLKRFQDRKKQQFQSNPERARRKRRFVHGIREVTKHLRSQRLKCVLIAPDCQSIQSEGGLNDAIEHIIRLCREQDLPFVFTLSRQKLGRCLNKVSRVSAIGIFDYSGAEQVYKQMIELTFENQRAYKQILEHDDNVPLTSTTNQTHGLNSREFFKILHRTFQQQQQQQQTNHMRAHIINHIPSESLSKLLPKVPAHHGHSRQTSDTSMIYIDPQLINSMKKQHTRASSGTFDHGHKKTHQRALSDGAAVHIDLGPPTVTVKHSRTPSGCSAISQIEQNDYFEQTKDILNNNNDIHHYYPPESDEPDENRLKSIVEDTEDNATYSKRKDVERWINEN